MSGDDDLVVPSHFANPQEHISECHVEPRSEDEIRLCPGILQRILVSIDCMLKVNGGANRGLHVRDKLLLSIEGSPCPEKACAGLGLRAEDCPDVRPDAVVNALYTWVGEALRLVEDKLPPGLVNVRLVLSDIVHVDPSNPLYYW